MFRPGDAEGVSIDSLIALKTIEQYRINVDFFEPPATARVFLSGESVKALSRGPIISEGGGAKVLQRPGDDLGERVGADLLR